MKISDSSNGVEIIIGDTESEQRSRLNETIDRFLKERSMLFVIDE